MKPMKKFFFSLPKNILRSFSIKNLPWHLGAIILTYFLVISGFDWFYFLHTRNSVLQSIFFPAIVIGGLIPIVLPLCIFVIGWMRKNSEILTAGFALAQAAIIGSCISSFYKALTGRIQPSMFDITSDISTHFQFGFLKHGIFWGWPSSHTTIAFAMAFALIFLYSHNKKIKWGACMYALYIGLGVSISIHWFSDFIAGALIGSIIGITVGKSFKK
jgi:membrane-associated phospholipid phosphatase